jgi:hypothetical protein
VAAKYKCQTLTKPLQLQQKQAWQLCQQPKQFLLLPRQ